MTVRNSRMMSRLACACVASALGLGTQSSAAQSATAAKPSAAMSLEQRVKAIEDREAILKTLYQYVYLVDFGTNPRDYTDLYTEDAIFDGNASAPPEGAAAREAMTPGKSAVIGTQGVEKWIINEWQNRDKLLAMGHYRSHEMMAPDITIEGNRATARCYFQTTDNDNGRIYVVSIGVYHDLLVRSADGRWRMKQRLLVRQGSVGNPGGRGRGATPAASPAPSNDPRIRDLGPQQ